MAMEDAAVLAQLAATSDGDVEGDAGGPSPTGGSSAAASVQDAPPI